MIIIVRALGMWIFRIGLISSLVNEDEIYLLTERKVIYGRLSNDGSMSLFASGAKRPFGITEHSDVN